MEQVITIQQDQANIWAIIEQVRNVGSSFVITDKDKPAIKISIAEELPKRKINYGFMNDENFKIPENFDRMNEDEICALFSGEYDEHTS